MKYTFCFILTILAHIATGQVVVNEEPAVRNLMDKFERIHKSEDQIDGWRIKIINTTDRREMERARFKFQQLFPDRKSTSSYENPYYSIRTGAYENRIEVEPFLVTLKEHFPNAIPVRDKIAKEEVLQALINGI